MKARALRRNDTPSPRATTGVSMLTKPSLICAFITWSSLAVAEEHPLRVLGSVRLHTTTSFAEDERIRVEGRLVDDANRGLPESTILISGAAGLVVSPCVPAGRLGARPAARSIPFSLQTDALGRFCTLVPQDAEDLRFSFRDPNDLLGKAEATVDLRAVGSPVALEFIQPGEDVSLDLPQVTIEVATRLVGVAPPDAAEVIEDPASPASIGVSLELERAHHPPRALDEATLEVGERARFEIDASALGEPGIATLVARATSPDGRVRAATAQHRITKMATTKLIPARESMEVSEDGWTIDVAVRSNFALRSGSTVPVESGTVELRIGDEPFAAAPVVNGIAQLRGAFPKAGAMQGSLHYRSASPWWRPGPEVRLALPEPAPQAAPRPWPWFVGSLALAAWTFLTWRRPRGRPRRMLVTEPPGHEEFTITTDDSSKLAGMLLDAHTGEPIASASVVAISPGVEHETRLAETQTDTRGHFVFSETFAPPPEGCRLVLEADGYRPMARPLGNRRGSVTVHLVTRRRALLSELVDWASRRGALWRHGGAPTPSDVVRAAQERSEPQVARWAGDIEAAAYGPTDVTEEADHRIQEERPRH